MRLDDGRVTPNLTTQALTGQDLTHRRRQPRDSVPWVTHGHDGHRRDRDVLTPPLADTAIGLRAAVTPDREDFARRVARHSVFPVSHAASAYLWYAAAVVALRRRPATGLALGPLAVASQLPDLVDKPLAFVGVLASGRSLAHSLFALVAVACVVWWGCRRVAPRVGAPRHARLLRDTPLAVTVGYASHLVGDAYEAVLAGQYGALSFLFFPLGAAPLSPADNIPPWVRLWRVYTAGGPDELLPLVTLAGLVFVGSVAWQRRRHRPAG